MKVCVTTDRLPLCSHHCKQNQVRFDVMPTRCVDRDQAQKLDLMATMEGDEMYIENERILSQMQSPEHKDLRVPVSQNCL